MRKAVTTSCYRNRLLLTCLTCQKTSSMMSHILTEQATSTHNEKREKTKEISPEIVEI